MASIPSSQKLIDTVGLSYRVSKGDIADESTEATAALKSKSVGTMRTESDLVNRIADVTILFWIIKILSTTVGETVADYLSQDLELGLVITSYIMTGAFLIAFYFQLRAKAYVPSIYWTVVVLISIVGTLISDNFVDNLGVSLVTTPSLLDRPRRRVHPLVSLRKDLIGAYDIHVKTRAVLLGGNSVDVFARNFGRRFGFGTARRWLCPIDLLFAALIAAITGGYYFLGLNAVLAFWLAYILTRPLGASMGDLLAKIPISAGSAGGPP